MRCQASDALDDFVTPPPPPKNNLNVVGVDNLMGILLYNIYLEHI